MDILVPNLGDIEEVEVIELCVSVGDTVSVDDTLVVIESDKASMDVPSTAAGKVESIAVAIGDMVTQGTVIVALAAAEVAAEEKDTSEETNIANDTGHDDETASATVTASTTTTGTTTTTATTKETDIDVLVPGIGDAGDVVVIEIAVQKGATVEVDDLLVVLESDKASMEIAAEHAGTVIEVCVSEGDEVEEGTKIATLKVQTSTVVAAIPRVVDDSPTLPSVSPEPQARGTVASDAQIYAGPAVRRLARELGVNLSHVKGSGNRNRIVKDDVKAFVKSRLQRGADSESAGIPQVARVDFSKFGPTETVELSRIRQRGAENLHRSWINLPHVTQHDEADLTDLEDFRKSLKREAEGKGIKITPLSFLVKACCAALREYPAFNASLHVDQKQLVLKGYINVGIAVDTPEGLVVPVVKDADTKSIWTLSEEIAQLSEKARNKKLALDDLQGGTFSISSLGALGGTGFTPIVNAPEVAILGVSRLQTKPHWDGQAFAPRKMLPLSLSYDHRVINGADGGRFMFFLTSVLGDIRRLAL